MLYNPAGDWRGGEFECLGSSPFPTYSKNYRNLDFEISLKLSFLKTRAILAHIE
jgi:hypothetical protein